MNGKTLFIGGLLYLAPQVLAYLSTRPSPSAAPTHFDRIRTKIAAFKETAYKTIGERRWEAGREIFLKNAWISFLALAYLAKYSPPVPPLTFFEKIEMSARGFVLFCGLAWLVRTAVTEVAAKLTQLYSGRPHDRVHL